MKDFLFEIFSEEIPASLQLFAKEQLSQLAKKGISSPLSAEAIETFVTPRRLALIGKGIKLDPCEPLEKQGPLVSAGTKAFEGFCRTWGLEVSQCEIKSTPKGDVWSAWITPHARPVEDHLIELSQTLLSSFFWPKRMRWLSSRTWVRPIRHLVCLYGDEVLEWSYEGLTTGRLTQGHRLWNRANANYLEILSPTTYEAQLKQAGVVLRQEERGGRIRDDLYRLADEYHCIPYPEEDLILENAGLTEWPTGLLGEFDSFFLELPPPVVETTLKAHQKCFPLVNKDLSSMAPYFIAVTNNLSPNDEIKRGYERVIRARLSDALFFWQQDKKKTLLEHALGLEQRIFFEGLGSLSDKMARLQSLAERWVRKEKNASLNLDKFRQCIALAKADLMTLMVGEFPSLQGVMGKYYALNEGILSDVAQALEDQYMWDGKNLSLGGLLAIIDAMDTLVGFFALSHRPSGSKDPMGLKRCASAVLKGCLGGNLSFSLEEEILFFLRAYHDQGFLKGVTSLPSLKSFFKERLAFMLEREEIDSSSISAALSLPEAWRNLEGSLFELDDPYVLAQRARRLNSFKKSAEGEAFLGAYRRVYALACHMKEVPARFEEAVLVSPQEQNLLVLLKRPLEENLLPAWTAPLHDFFENIKVTEPAYQSARLGLLHQIMAYFEPLGHFPSLLN